MKENEPLSEVRKKLRIQWYRCHIEKEVLRDLSLKSDYKGFIQAGGHLGLFICTGILSYYFFEQKMWIAFIIFLFAHGTIGSFFYGLATHELCHGTVFRSRKLNKVFLYILSILSWHNFYEYSYSHTYHHLYTCNPKGDREVVLGPQFTPNIGFINLLQLFTFNFFGDRELRHGCFLLIIGTIKTSLGLYSSDWIRDVYAGHEEDRKKAVNLSRMILIFHVSVIVFSIFYGLWVLPLLVTFFNFIGNWLVYFVGVPMHIGLMSNTSDFRKCVRTILLDPISEFLYWHMNWHTEHHMYAGVPCYNLKKLHKLVADDMPQPRSLIGAWKEILVIRNKQNEDPQYQFNTPIPVRELTKTEKYSDPLTLSIGDLAPKSLKSDY